MRLINEAKTNEKGFRFCRIISELLLRLYLRFRKCSGLEMRIKKTVEEYKVKESKLENIEKLKPRLEQGINDLELQNQQLLKAVVNMHNDIKSIKNALDSNDKNTVKRIFNKYELFDSVK